MKNRKVTLTSVFLLLLSIPQVVCANSSWVWISTTRPYDLLPLVAIVTIIIEVGMTRCYVKNGNYFRILIYIAGANIASFLCPYIVNYCKLVSVKGHQPMREMFAHWPTYTVGLYFLVMTLVIELPIVYLGLKEKAKDSKKLKWTIIIANILTTTMVAVVERMLCQGHW